MIKWQNLALIKELLWNRIPAIDPITWWMRHEMLLKWINKWLLRAALTLSPSLSCPLRLNFELFATSWCGKHKHTQTLTRTLSLVHKFSAWSLINSTSSQWLKTNTSAYVSTAENLIKWLQFIFHLVPFFHFPDTMTDGLTEFRTENYEIHIERTSAGLGLSIAGGRGSTPYKGNDEGIFISRVTEGGPADLAGLKVGDKVLKVNGISVIEADHYHAVDILKACGSVLVLVVSREITRLVGHPVFTNEGPVAQIVISNQPTHTVPIQQTEQIINTSAKTIPSPIQIHSEHQEQHLSTPHSNGFIENGRVILPLHVSQNKVQIRKKNSFPYVDKKNVHA